MAARWFGSFGAPPVWPHAEGNQVILTHQGRTAVGLLCEALRLGPQDEVLVPAYNCGAEVDPFMRARCRVGLFRVDRRARIDVADIERRLTKATKVVYVTHYFGWPQDIRGLAETCRQRGIVLVEDCAQALLNAGSGGSIGSYGDAMIYSMVKFLALPDGGALVLRGLPALSGINLRYPSVSWTWRASLPLFKRWVLQSVSSWRCLRGLQRRLSGSARSSARARDSQGRPELLQTNLFRESEKDWGMARSSVGLFRKTDFQRMIAKRRSNFAVLHGRLRNPDHLTPLHDELPDDVCPVAYPVFAKDGARARSYFEECGILVQGWPGYYPGFDWDEFPDTCHLKDHLLTLPIHQDLCTTQIEYIATCANTFNGQA